MARKSNETKARELADALGVELDLEDPAMHDGEYAVEVWGRPAHMCSSKGQHMDFARGRTQPQAWADALAILKVMQPCDDDCECREVEDIIDEEEADMTEKPIPDDGALRFAKPETKREVEYLEALVDQTLTDAAAWYTGEKTTNDDERDAYEYEQARTRFTEAHARLDAALKRALDEARDEIILDFRGRTRAITWTELIELDDIHGGPVERYLTPDGIEVYRRDVEVNKIEVQPMVVQIRRFGL